MFATLTEKLIAAGLLIVAIAGAFGTYTFHERHLGAAAKVAELKVSSDKLVIAATKKVADLTTQHAAQVAAIVGVLDNERKVSVAQSGADALRLREYDTYRSQHPAIRGSATGPGVASAGGGGSSGDDERLTSLEQVALQLATADRDGKNALSACMADRNDLAGK